MPITSLLDQDAYAFTVGNTVFHFYPKVRVKYRFLNRGNIPFGYDVYKGVLDDVDRFCDLRFKATELRYLADHIPNMTGDYLEYLHEFRPNRDDIHISHNGTDIEVEFLGKWVDDILLESPVLSMISDRHYTLQDKNWNTQDLASRTLEKIEFMERHNLDFMEAGTRRRRSQHVQFDVLSQCAKSHNFKGTSNVLMAKELGVPPLGTQSHQWYSAVSALEDLRNANFYGMDLWLRVNKCRPGIVLPDTFGIKSFFKNFDHRFASLFSGLRWDSGPYDQFINQALDRYRELEIDPWRKLLVFSEGQTKELAFEISQYLARRTQQLTQFGRYLVNDFPGSPPLDIVVKLLEVEGVPVVKLSDSIKQAGDPKALEYAKWVHWETGGPIMV